jgi:nicotinate-nucleotide adenylyltransferase
VKRIGILAGAFNPVTRAHIALIEAALPMVDEAVCVVPRAYPHKEFHGAGLEDRLEMLRRASDRYRVEVTQGGLFVDIARELHSPEAEPYFICGRDAAERLIAWEHDEPLDRIFDEFHLLVAARGGVFQPPPHLAGRIHPLPVAPDLEEISSTEVRRRIARGEPWQHLVPEPITEMVGRIYSR